MKSFFSMFKESAAELKNVRCITTTGLLVALYIILDMFSLKIGESIKINFDFIATATIGMLFGPVPAVLAAVAGDFIGCILTGNSPLPLLSLLEVLKGLLYGMMLYKKSGIRLVILSIIARVIDSAVICLVLNTAALMYYGYLSRTSEQLYMRYGKIATELIFFIPLMIFLMPAVCEAYERLFGRRKRSEQKN